MRRGCCSCLFTNELAMMLMRAVALLRALLHLNEHNCAVLPASMDFESFRTALAHEVPFAARITAAARHLGVEVRVGAHEAQWDVICVNIA